MRRAYNPEDFCACKAIVDQVWDFDAKFAPPRLAELFKTIYVGGSLAESNFATVVEAGGEVQGFLFGRCGEDRLISNEYSGMAGRLRLLFQLLTVPGLPLSAKVNYLKIISAHEVNRRQIEPSRKSEVNLFAVSPDAQGSGYGKILMTAFIDFCRARQARRITLESDAACNTGFYDALGFRIKGEFFSPLQQAYTGGSGMSFIYELVL